MRISLVRETRGEERFGDEKCQHFCCIGLYAMMKELSGVLCTYMLSCFERVSSGSCCYRFSLFAMLSSSIVLSVP